MTTIKPSAIRTAMALGVAACLLLGGCKREQPAPASATTPDTAPAATAPAAAPATASPAAATTASPDAGDPHFDLAKVPQSAATLPAFPYLPWAPKLHGPYLYPKLQQEFDAAYVIAGERLRRVEGALEVREIDLKVAQLTREQGLALYRDAIKALGGVRISTADVNSQAFIVAHGGNSYDIRTKQLRLDTSRLNYESYVIRTADQRVWIGLADGDSTIRLVVIDEKPLQQSIHLLKAP